MGFSWGEGRGTAELHGERAQRPQHIAEEEVTKVKFKPLPLPQTSHEEKLLGGGERIQNLNI